MAGVEQALTEVEYPYLRRNLVRSVAALADEEYQQRVWVFHEVPFVGYYDELTLRVHILFDDLEVLPEPLRVDGSVVLPGVEVERLAALGRPFDEMITRLGNVPDHAYLDDPQWTDVVELASSCLPALILAGGWEETPTDVGVHAEDLAERPSTTVDEPATRRRVIKAVAALADEEYQRNTWTGDSSDPVTGSLHTCVQTLIDDARVVPQPRNAIGRVLLAGDEIDRLTTLSAQLSPFTIDPQAGPQRSPSWAQVVTAARHLLPALVIAGAWMGLDPEPER